MLLVPLNITTVTPALLRSPHLSRVIPSIITSSHDSQYTLPLLLHMIVTLLPVIVILVSLPDPIVIVLFRAIGMRLLCRNNFGNNRL